nr:uncharacterized protein LOC124817215 [Hydra vulgaris]
MTYNLDTKSFLNAFYRMVYRRGLPLEVLTDNGTNFVGGCRELNEVVNDLDMDKITNSTADKEIKWHFNAPQGSHLGGVFEIMVKAVKRAMTGILKKADITDKELCTAFTGAESLLNSRPLTYQSANIKDDIPLTPNHFLIGQVGGQFAPDSVQSKGYHPKKPWRQVQELLSHFWKRIVLAVSNRSLRAVLSKVKSSDEIYMKFMPSMLSLQYLYIVCGDKILPISLFKLASVARRLTVPPITSQCCLP